MVAQIVGQSQAKCALLVEGRKHWNKMLSENEFINLEDMLKVLEPLSNLQMH